MFELSCESQRGAQRGAQREEGPPGPRRVQRGAQREEGLLGPRDDEPPRYIKLPRVVVPPRDDDSCVTYPCHA